MDSIPYALFLYLISRKMQKSQKICLEKMIVQKYADVI